MVPEPANAHENPSVKCAKMFYDGSISEMIEENVTASWIKPHESSIKVTVDATTFSMHSSFRIWMVARYSNGEQVQPRTVSKQGMIPAKMAEAWAINEVFSWINNQAR